MLGGRNIKLHQAEFINMDLLSGDPWFNKDVDLVKKIVVKSFFEWLAEVFVQRLPTEKELEIPDISCLVMTKGF